MDVFTARIFQQYRDELLAAITKLKNKIAMGHATDHADYRYQAGKIQGLADALDLLENFNLDDKGNKREG